MDVELDIVRHIDCEAEDGFFASVVRETVARSGVPSFSAFGDVSVGIALVQDDEIAAFNGTYRDKPAPTDVLSFSYCEEEEISSGMRGDFFLGDLVIAPDFVRRSAEEDGVPFLKELAFVCSHGTLHLLGFDHSAEMFRIQDEVTDSVSVAPVVQ